MAKLEPLVVLLLLSSCRGSTIHRQVNQKRDAEVPYLPYLQLDEPIHVLPRDMNDVDICSDPINVPGNLPFGDIRVPSLSVCENGVILTNSTKLRSFLCVCRGQSRLCEDPGTDLYLIAPLWTDVNNLTATESSLTYQVFEESVESDESTLQQVWYYVYNNIDGFPIIFYPTWMMVAHWSDVHPYISPNVIDPRTNTFQAIVLSDGIQSYTIFTYNCTDLEWAKTNSLVIADCSFIGYYTGTDFLEPAFDGLQIDNRTANITQASCSGSGVSWSNHLFTLSLNYGVTVSAVKEQIKVLVGDQVTMRFLLSGLVEYTDVHFVIEPLDNSTDVYIQVPCSNNNESNVLVESFIVVESSFFCARVSLTLADVKQESFGRYNLRVFYDENEVPVIASTDLIQAKTPEEEMAEDLVDMTSNPAQLTSEDIANASLALENLTQSAIDNEDVREDYLITIDNLMRANGETIVESQIQNQSSTRILNSLSLFTSQVELPENSTNVTFTLQSYGIQLFDISQESFDGQTFAVNLGSLETARNLSIPLTMDDLTDQLSGNATVYVQVPSETLGEGSDDDKNRLSFVVYRQDSLFQNSTNGSGVTIESLVVAVNSSFVITQVDVAIGYVKDMKEEKATVCSDFDPGGSGGLGAWSGDNCEEVPCRSGDRNHTCCECHVFGHFGLLLSVTPTELDEGFQTVLVVFSYLGAGISIICLTILLTTYILSKKLRKSTNGKLLINLAISLLCIYIFFIISGHIRMYGDNKTTDIFCGFSSAFLHYFMLVYFGWTAAEALNLYFSLVKVFEAKTISRYPLKAGLIVWLVPLVVVIISAGAGNEYYVNDVYCRPVQWPFYFAFILPIAVIFLFDWGMFIRIMIALYKHTRQREQLVKKDTSSLKTIKQNARYAIVLATLFGIGWVFGLVATAYPDAPMGLTFALQLLFCIFVSAQGFLFFVFQVVASKDAGDFWLDLFGKCIPAVKTYKASRSKSRKKKKSSKMPKKLTNLFKAPASPLESTTSSPGPMDTSTLGRGQHLESGITESSEATYQLSTLPRPGHSTLLSPTNIDSEMSTEDFPSEMTSGTLVYPPFELDQLSLQDEV